MLEVAVKARLGAFSLDAEFTTADVPVTALFGRSGAGKTSVIDSIAGLARPSEGRIVLDSRVLFDSERGINLDPARRRVGVVFQSARLFPHLTVRGNLHYGWRRAPANERKLNLDAVLGPLGIGPLLDRRPATLSGGEQQRVAVGRALLANPKLLLMDEPLASLDGERKAELLPMLAELPRAFRVPIVYVSHAVDEVLRLADRLVLIDAGRVIAAGPVEDVANRADFAQIAAREGGPEAFTVVAATVLGHDAAAAQTRLSFGGGALTVPLLHGTIGSRVRLRIAAGDVMLATAPPQGLSVRNVIAARITSVTEVGPLVEVILETGGPLRCRVTRAARDEMGLAPGMTVYALIKSAAMTGGAMADPGA